MNQYATLEEALQDPFLVILTDRFATMAELKRAYIRFIALPKRQKRFSNYYSVRFLGLNVPDMYEALEEELMSDNDILKGWLEPDDAFLVSEPDLYYNEEAFMRGDTNLCFVLGHSGSGKSVMSRSLEGDDVDHIELDDLLLPRDHFTKEDLENYSDMFAAFFNGVGADYYIGLEERENIPKDDYEDKLFVDFVNFAFEYAGQHKEKKYILDGIWIYLYFDDPSVFEEYAVFIKGTSFLKSKIRVMKRERQRDREELLDRKNMFGREKRNYLLDEPKINRYRTYFENRPETIFREETSEAAEASKAVINELNNIDICFAVNDADGISEIRERAVANDAFSALDKMRISTECQLALVDLGLQGRAAAKAELPG